MTLETFVENPWELFENADDKNWKVDKLLLNLNLSFPIQISFQIFSRAGTVGVLYKTINLFYPIEILKIFITWLGSKLRTCQRNSSISKCNTEKVQKKVIESRKIFVHETFYPWILIFVWRNLNKSVSPGSFETWINLSFNNIPLSLNNV